MQKLRYLIFLLFNLAYKDNKYNEGYVPYVNSVIVLVVFQYIILFITFVTLNKFFLFSEFLEPVFATKWSQVIPTATLLAFINYYFFVKKKYFDRLYNEFKESPINTKRNRIISYTGLVLYWIVIIGVLVNLKDWLE